MKVLIVIILVAIAGYFGYRYFTKPKPSEPPPAVEVKTEPAPSEPVSPVTAPRTNPVATTASTRVTSKPPGTAPVTPTPEANTEWKTKLDEILASNANSERKLQQIRELLSKLPDPQAEQAVQALTTMVKDEAFAFIKPLVVDPNLPEPVRDEFMVDLMNRPHAIKIPLFLEIARNPNHPDHESAFETLEIFTGLKFGADWNAWEKGIDTWIKENPDPKTRKAPAQVN